MSLETWKEEFYPIDAEYVSEEDAVEHSLRKWIGLRKANLDKHGVSREKSSIKSGYNSLWISGNSCALCVHYLDDENDEERNCELCPLARLLGRPCDEGESSEYAAFIGLDNPEPMIAALEQLVDGEHNE